MELISKIFEGHDWDLNEPKVLLIEDDMITRWMVRVAVKGSCLLATAANARRAIRSYYTYQPDLVLLDIDLAGHNGKDLLRRIMRINPHAHVVMFSAFASPENISESLENGAKGFITKPFTKDDLLKYITSCPTNRWGAHI